MKEALGVMATDYESKEFFLTLLDHLPTLIFLKSNSLRFMYVNKALADVFGTTKDEIIGKTDSDFIKDTDQVQHFKNDDRTVLLQRTPLLISQEFLNDSQGTLRRLATVKVPLTWNGTIHVLGLATDITEIESASTQHDQVRLAVISELAHIVKAPIASALFNLNALDLQLGNLHRRPASRLWPQSATMSHEVGRMKINIDFIRKALIDINVSSRTFTSIAQSLHHAPTTSEPDQRSLVTVLLDTVREVNRIVPSARLRFDSILRPEEIRLKLDPSDWSLVKSAFYNILHNAIKFSPSENPIQLSLTAEHREVHVQIKDKGIGISPGDLPRIFLPGFSRKREGHSAGTGMGLTIAKETFERLNWRIFINSALGEGTTVDVFIPFKHES